MFNALKYTQELEQAGFSRAQADTSLKILIEVMNENFATKSDLLETETRLRSEISEVRSDLLASEARVKNEINALKIDFKSIEASIRELDYKLTIRLGLMLTAAVGITTTLFRLAQNFH
jgi:hypothetical protein